MTLGEACDLVQGYAETYTGRDVLAALREMESSYDDLDNEHRLAYNMFMAAGRRMFATLEQ
jgi:hypothetical protein